MASQLPSFVIVYLQTPWRLVKVTFLLKPPIRDVVGTVVLKHCPGSHAGNSQSLGDTGTMHLLFQPWVTEPELTVEN